MSVKSPLLAIVVPCYNEQEALPLSVPVLLDVIERAVAEGLAGRESFLLLCDDGSTDATWNIIKDFHSREPRVKGLSLAANRGHQNVLLAGLECAREHGADALVSIDADLQDDSNKILDMLRLYHKGCEIVYGVRSDRSTDSWFKRTTANAFYSMQRGLGLKTIVNHADFRLMSGRAVDMLMEYGEANLYLRGIVPQLGLKTAVVEYARTAREAGTTHYPLRKMLSLGVDGITSFTAKPMRMIFYVGMILLLVDIGVAIYVLSSYLYHVAISGWTSIMLSLWFLGSLILMALGIIGEYIGKIYIESKHRPRYKVADELFD
ncbi:MAG: glycosyltransferase family 2 protein [Muribaculaceae bacterium]|nr:glycosyltransferase family 2 protein [Muribaculaceae bacterium]